MIPMTAASLSALVAGGQKTSDEQPQGEGFLDALLASLPPEAQGLSLQELVDWLKEQEGGALAAAGLTLPQALMPQTPQQAATALPLSVTDGNAAKEADPQALLGLIMSSRSSLPADGEADPMNALQAAGALEGDGQEQTQLQSAAADNPFKSLLQATATMQRSTTPATPANAPVQVPVQHPDFSQAVGERLVWMVRNDVQEAKIRLDPPHLGPLEISVSVKEDRANILIHATHAVTRDVLEADMPRLRGMLGDNGFASVDVNVARDNGRQQNGGGRPGGEAATGSVDVDGVGVVQSDVPASAAVGLVDHYA